MARTSTSSESEPFPPDEVVRVGVDGISDELAGIIGRGRARAAADTHTDIDVLGYDEMGLPDAPGERRLTFELAQVNVARLSAPIDSVQLQPFVDALDHVNAEAEASPGFRWRLQSENGNATDVVAFEWDHTAGDAGIIVNLSTWADAASLRAFVFGGDHVGYLRRRREWFVHMTEAHAVCWWVEVGHRPTTDEAEERVRHRRAHGATAHAFDLRSPYPPPDASP